MIAQGPWRERLVCSTGPARARLLLTYLLDKLGALLDVPTHDLDPSRTFGEFSADSLQAVTFKAELERELGLTLRSTLLFDHPTPDALCAHLLTQLEGEAPTLHPGDRPAKERVSASEPIAIVGAACRLPGGSNDIVAFWDLLISGRDAIVPLDDERLGVRWASADLSDVPAFAGLVDDVVGFDSRLFGISSKEAEEVDPQQRILLQVAWEALENAGIAPYAAEPREAAVFVGTRGSEYHDRRSAGGQPAYQGTGASVAALSGRLAHTFGLTGAALTLDTACSASLVALHSAVEELRRSNCRFALVGGVNLLLSPFAMRATSAARMLAPDGRCKTFSASANGYVRSEGCVVLVLRRLSDARANGERVLGVIRGSAVNHDGTTSGLTVPSASAQTQVVQKAVARAQVSPAELSYVECHGTGTELGDPIEIQALSAALGASSRETPLWVGSVKSQIGHTEPTAGLAGVLKVLLAMRHRRLPATLHCGAGLNPHVAWSSLGIQPAASASPLGTGVEPVLAGVSAFGFTGTNAHVVLASEPEPAPLADDWGLLTLSARTPTALRALVSKWKEWLPGRSEREVAAACRASNRSRSCLPYRRALSCARSQDLAAALANVEDSNVGRSGAGQPPTIATSPDTSEELFAFELGLRGCWPGFENSLVERREAIAATVGRGAVELTAPLRALAVACALGDALSKLGVTPEKWAADGIGGAAAHVLAGAPLANVVAIVASGGALTTLRSASVMSRADLAERQAAEGARVIWMSAQAPGKEWLWFAPERRSLTDLAAHLFEAGLNLDWRSLGAEGGAIPLDLPTYPFELETVWRASDESANRPSTHSAALELEEVCSPALLAGARAFRVQLDSQRQAWLKQHTVERLPILPAAGVLALLHRVARRLLSDSVAIRELELTKAIVLLDGEPLTLHLTSQWDSAREAHLVEVYSSSGSSAAFVLHARALVASAERAEQIVVPATADGVELAPEQVYGWLRAAGIEHGPDFRALERLEQIDTCVEVTVAVPLAEASAWGTIGLDACFIASAALLSARGDRVSRLPVGCDELTIVGELPRRLRATVRLRVIDEQDVARCDLDLFDERGTTLGQVRGLRLAARSRAVSSPPLRALTVRWSAQALALAPHPGPQRIYEVVSDDRTLAERLCSVLVGVHGATAIARRIGEPITASAAQALSGPRHVVWLNTRLSGPDFLSSSRSEIERLLAAESKSQFWCVTRGAFTDSTNGPDAFAQLSRSVLWGFGRSFQQAQPRLRCTLLDFEAELSDEAQCELLAAEFRRNAVDAQVRYANGARQVPQLVDAETLPADRAQAALSKKGSYLVTGGAGGLGRLAVEWLADGGAGHIIIASRSPQECAPIAEYAAARGARLSIWEVDIADRAALSVLLGRVAASEQPLRGVIHAAGLVKDQLISELDERDLERVLAPKVAGSWNLHELTSNAPLDFFVVYSSLAGVLGSPGQAAYAGANAFLDALVRARNLERQPGCSLAWGPWSEVGMASRARGGAADRLERLGVFPLSNSEGLQYLLGAVLGSSGLMVVARVDWNRYAQSVEPRLLALLPQSSLLASATPVGQLGAELRALAPESPDEATRRLESYLRARIVDVAGTRAISEHDSFFELGLDSLQAVALRNRIELDLGVVLSASLIFDYPTLGALRGHLAFDHLGLRPLRPEPSSSHEPTGARFELPGPAHFESLELERGADADDDAGLGELEASLRALERELGR